MHGTEDNIEGFLVAHGQIQIFVFKHVTVI